MTDEQESKSVIESSFSPYIPIPIISSSISVDIRKESNTKSISSAKKNKKRTKRNVI